SLAASGVLDGCGASHGLGKRGSARYDGGMNQRELVYGNDRDSLVSGIRSLGQAVDGASLLTPENAACAAFSELLGVNSVGGCGRLRAPRSPRAVREKSCRSGSA